MIIDRYIKANSMAYLSFSLSLLNFSRHALELVPLPGSALPLMYTTESEMIQEYVL